MPPKVTLTAQGATGNTATVAQVQALSNQVTALTAQVTALQSSLTTMMADVQKMGEQGTAAINRLSDLVGQLKCIGA